VVKYVNDFLQLVVQNIMDFEALVKILSSPNKHIIVYAGGTHCEGIMFQLVTYFNFKTLIDIGIISIENYIAPLSEQAWNFLTTPFSRFSLKNLLHESDLKRLFSER